MSKAKQKNSIELTLSSNSGSPVNSDADSEIFQKPKAKNTKTRRVSAKTVQVPKRYFTKVFKTAVSGKPVVKNEDQTEAKRQCDRFIATELKCTANMVDGCSSDSITRLVGEMRNCLLRQDWFQLARFISMYTEMPLGKCRWYPTVLRYCVIALLHDPVARNTDLLGDFLEGVIGCQSEDEKKAFLDNIKDLPSNIHTSKYSDLWKTEVKSEENYLTKASLQKLNNLLSKKADEDQSDNVGSKDNEGDDGWETMDESDEDEGDKPVDLESILAQIESDFTETESIASFRK